MSKRRPNKSSKHKGPVSSEKSGRPDKPKGPAKSNSPDKRRKSFKPIETDNRPGGRKGGKPSNRGGNGPNKNSNSNSPSSDKSSSPDRGKWKHGYREDGGRGSRHHRDDSNSEPSHKIPPELLEKAREETNTKLTAWIKAGDEMRAAASEKKKTPDIPVFDQLDPWQRQAFDALQRGASVVVDAPTTAGKTRVVEAYFAMNINNPGFRAAYTTPVKSLSNDKLRELRQMFGSENVGIATGDIKENLDAPIVVATLESYRNSLLGVEPDLGRNLVVFDEYHFLQDESRGSAWEEALILTPKSCQVLLLSASVANAEEFRVWLNKLSGKEVELVRTITRPVPLTSLVYTNNEWLLADSLPQNVFAHPNRRLMEMPVRPDELVPRLLGLEKIGLTPCIVYAGRRLACENLAFAIMKSLEPLSQEHSEKIGAALQESHEEVKCLSFIPMQMRRMLQTFGVGFHHSGLAPPARMGVEKLVKLGLLRYCTATMGLSVGINFAVRSALISDYTRPGEAGFTDYNPSEVLQMLGRAGRRGRDPVGFSLWPTPESFLRLAGAKRERCDSRLKNDPTTFLGLVGRGFSLGAIQGFYEKSFRRFKDPKVDLSLIRKSETQAAVEAQDIPCSSPPAEVARYWAEDATSLCHSCKYIKKCHPYLERRTNGGLAHLHVHLHALGALNRDETLTPFGDLARFFPQSGGLVFARCLADAEITMESLLKATQLTAGMSLARFKEPNIPGSYRFPWNAKEIEARITSAYPLELFPEVYDFGPRGRANKEGAQNSTPTIREFNPAAGYIIRSWLEGTPWIDLAKEVQTEFFGVGDIMGLLYRVATWMQSLSQTKTPELSSAAKQIRDQILREPLAFTLTI